MWRKIGRALLLRCPNCGRGTVFTGWTQMLPSCPNCAHVFERHEGYWLGAIAINTILTIVFFSATLVGLLLATGYFTLMASWLQGLTPEFLRSRL